MNREEIIDAILEINFKLRSCEESLAFVLEKFDAGIVLEKETDTALLKHPPITSLEGIEVVLERLDHIEDSVKCLIAELAIGATLDLARVAQIIKEKP